MAIWPWVKVMIHLCDILSRSNMAVGSNSLDTVLDMCAVWHWPWRYVMESRSCHNLWSWTITVWNIIQIQLGSEELWLGHRFWVCVHCELGIRDMTLGQGHGTPETVPFTVTGMSATVGVPTYSPTKYYQTELRCQWWQHTMVSECRQIHPN